MTANHVRDLPAIAKKLNQVLQKCQPEFIKTCKVEVGCSLKDDKSTRLGLIATEPIKKGDIALSVAYDDQIVLTPDLATKQVWKDVLPEKYDGWTGDNGMIALLILNELAKTSSSSSSGAGIPKPSRKSEASDLISAWMEALPSPNEMRTLHPYLWSEDDQEILQSSSTKKIYRILDDIDEDASWLEERIWSQDRTKFPETVELNGETYPCFSRNGFAWAMCIAVSRSVYVDGSLRLIPIIDFANHDDVGVEEVQGGTMGPFGTTKGALIRAGSTRSYEKGKEVYVSYGPKSAAEYLLEHGFLPKSARSLQTCVAELTFELDQDDRFYDDKLDVLEFETYDNAPMEPIQSFDVVSESGREGEPDPAMVQFLRLVKLGSKDAFLLESVFRKEVWDFMSMPVSEGNERDVLDAIANLCSKGLDEMEGVEDDESVSDEVDGMSPASLCAIVRKSEHKALSRTIEYVNREKEALDLKEYYQERRLKDLGLDSDWNPEESGAAAGDPYGDDDMAFGQRRAPGSLDW
jgi:Rubisco LSMT substrate-binding.